MTKHITDTEALVQVAAREVASGLDALKGEMLALAEVIPTLLAGQPAACSPAQLAKQDAECEAQFDNMPV